MQWPSAPEQVTLMVVHHSEACCDSAAQTEATPQVMPHSSDHEPQGMGSAFSLAALSQGMVQNIAMSTPCTRPHPAGSAAGAAGGRGAAAMAAQAAAKAVGA